MTTEQAPGATPVGPDADALWSRLQARAGVRVPLPALLGEWAAAAPFLHADSDRLPRLVAALGELADAGRLRLPAARSWDASTRPPLPRFVTVVREAVVRERPWQQFPWRAELGWAASLPTMTAAQFAALQAANTFLAAPDDRIVPARLRSAQLLGDEKALEVLDGSAVWGPDRLSYALLRCRRLAPPLASVRVGDGPDVLVVENADPYWALADLLSGSSTAIGLLAWGAGRGFEQSVVSLWQHENPRTVFYAGDLDPDGIAIATAAAARAAREGHAVIPHTGLWRALAACDPTGVGLHPWSKTDGSWMGELWPATEHVRAASGRVAQERLSMEDLAAAVC